jgi:outer membrane protein assembly factor BamD (BamD/ComL family)
LLIKKTPLPIIIKTIQEGIMSNKEIDHLFNSGMDQMRKGNFKEAEALFERAKNMTEQMQKK